MSEIGDYALRFALIVGLVGLVAGFVGGRLRNDAWTRLAERSLLVVFAFVTLAMGVLFAAFVNNDFHLAYVAGHSSRAMALPYRLAALWGGQAGSLLLWLWMLSAYGMSAVLMNRRQNRSLMPWVSLMLHANCLFFLVLLNFISKPFELVPPGSVLSDGAGLNPLLHHPVMMIHPLALYTGLVGFAVPFAFAFAALATGELGAAWFRTTRRSTLFAWTFLSIGVILGGRWAYEVLGWGGYWAWDPVENASFMPWLSATAFLHSVMIQEKRNMLKAWNLVLIGLTYTLCLFGTFLTRSGIVQSVHAFAQTPLFQSVFLGYVLFSALLFFVMVWIRRDGIRSPNKLESMVSREATFLLNNWVFIALLAMIFTGTMFPVFSELFMGSRIAVGPKYFNLLGSMLAVPLLLLTGVGPLIAWRKASIGNLRNQFTVPVIVGVATAAAVWFLVGPGLTLYAGTMWSLCAFVLATIVQEYVRAIRARVAKGEENVLQALGTLLRKNQTRYGGYIVHLGVVLLMAGTAGSVLNQERLENLKPGEQIDLRDYRLEYLTATPIPEQHYGGATARLALFRGDEPLGVMTPQKRLYWLEQQPASVPSVYSTLREDIYVILTNIEADGSATFKVYRNPLVNWIWIGGYVFVLGSIVVMWPHPRRNPLPEVG
jgi:cytochrome c-type biogenesis protein CcmF